MKYTLIHSASKPDARASLTRSAVFSGLFLAMVGGFCFAQETQQPSAAPSAPPNSATARHSDDFLVRGTVFTQEGFALPGAELRIRRSAEKKFRWETIANSRGDFAVRVKMGADYEVQVRAKGYEQQSLPLDAKTGDRYKDLVFRMQHQVNKKS